MNCEWILNPITTYAVLASGLLLCLYLFISLKAESQAVRKIAHSEARDLAKVLEVVRVQVNDVETYIKDAEGTPATQALGTINFTRRAKALRMYRRGETASSIAAALGAPRNEVDLMIKVSRLMAQSEISQSGR